MADRPDVAVPPDPDIGRDQRTRADDRPGTDGHVRADDGEWIDNHTVFQMRRRVDDRGGVLRMSWR